MLAAVTNWPAVTAAPDSVRLPAPGMVVIRTLAKAFAPDTPAASAGSV